MKKDQNRIFVRHFSIIPLLLSISFLGLSACSRYQQERFLISDLHYVAGKTELSPQFTEIKLDKMPKIKTGHQFRLYISEEVMKGDTDEYYAKCIRPRNTICLKDGRVIIFKGALTTNEGELIELKPVGGGHGIADLSLETDNTKDFSKIEFSSLRLQTSESLNIDQIVDYPYQSK
jgi:hypothetical protein